MTKQIRNIAILAHVDAGKTTITENILYLAGKIKTVGSVDNGTTQTDSLPVERERGITVKSSIISLDWNDNAINIIDAPGHVDFSADVERILGVVDGVVLVLSAVEGVQAHTETIFNALKNQGIPTILFINKIDRVGADVEAVINEIRKELTDKIIILQSVENEGKSSAIIHSRFKEKEIPVDIIEAAANCNDLLLEKYLDGEKIWPKQISETIVNGVEKAQLIPLLMGSAKNEIGIKELLNFIIEHFPNSNSDKESDFSALVFGIDHDKTAGKIALVRIFEGSVKNRDEIVNVTQNATEKVTQIKGICVTKSETIQSAEAGQVVGLGGLSSAQIGDFLGQIPKNKPISPTLHSPLLTVQVKAKNENDYAALAEALTILNIEDPSLGFEWLRDENELNLKIMGWIQMQILEHILLNRFNIETTFEEPTVIYRETPTQKGEGYVRYWMPKPCWAIMRFLIEPGERNSGVQYSSIVSVDKIHQKYQNEVERTIKSALKQGIKGWEVTDLKITLIDGEDHEVHSHPGDFVVATPMGIMDGLTNTGTTFLEPILSFKISAAEELLGNITSDIQQMRGRFDSPTFDNGKFFLTGFLPLATSIDYPVKLSSRSGGKAKIVTTLHGYEPCSEELGVIRSYKGISPLDTAKYILKARKAIQ